MNIRSILIIFILLVSWASHGGMSKPGVIYKKNLSPTESIEISVLDERIVLLKNQTNRVYYVNGEKTLVVPTDGKSTYVLSHTNTFKTVKMWNKTVRGFFYANREEERLFIYNVGRLCDGYVVFYQEGELKLKADFIRPRSEEGKDIVDSVVAIKTSAIKFVKEVSLQPTNDASLFVTIDFTDPDYNPQENYLLNCTNSKLVFNKIVSGQSKR